MTTDDAPVPARPVDVLLADGRVARIRPVRPDDAVALAELHDHVSHDALRFRFFSANRDVAHRYAAHLAHPDPGGRLIALVALLGDDVIGVASAEPVGPDLSEVAFLVADNAHGLGVGTLLLEHLAAAARGVGILRFTAEVLGDNHAMLRVFTDCGFTLTRSAASGVTTLLLDIAASDAAVAAADAREAHAEAWSLRALRAPHSVAVVGARREVGGVGRAVLDAIRRGAFAGDVYVVHPGAAQIAGVPTYPDFAAIGHAVDLAVIAVPASQVLATARAAAEAGTSVAVVLSSGLGETGPEGLARQRQLVEIARRHSMRVVGPNCLGVMANDPAVGLNATFATSLPPTGGVAVASQSGGVGIALLDRARETGLGIASFVSLGNKADVSGNDLLCAWMEDDGVTAAALYLESFGNARKFARVARRFAESRPLLAITGGRSDSGRRAGLSHTAAAAAPSVGVDALFAQSGVIGCDDIDTLVDTARLLTTQPLPSGPRLVILGNAGGLGVLAADAAVREGLVVPPLSEELHVAMIDAADGITSVDNPVDLGAAATPANMLRASQAVLASDEADALLLVVVGTSASNTGAFLDPLAALRVHPEKPVLVVPHGGVELPARPGLAGFASVDRAVRALARSASYAAWRALPAEPVPSGVAAAVDHARELVAAHRPGPADHGWVAPAAVRDLLTAYRVHTPQSTVVQGRVAAEDAAERLGFPVVLKAANPSLVHKSDRGLVRQDLTSRRDVRSAAAAIAAELRTAFPELLVQEQVRPGIELAAGVVRDPGFGPLVMVAAGGVAIDVWDDRAFLMPPLSRRDVAAALRSLRIWPLLHGHRGAPGVDLGALEDLVLAVGQLALDVPEIAELDLNPIIGSPTAATCVDAKLRLDHPTGPDDAGIPRRLRAPA